MSSVTGSKQQGFIARLKDKKRFGIKRLGKRLIHSLGGFLGRQSLVGDTPFIDENYFPHLKVFADNWETIRDEVREILKFRDEIPFFQEVSRDQRKISRGQNWRTFILFGFGEKAEKNCRAAPETTRLLETVPNLQTAWFSILAPGYHIPAHVGVTKGILRTHVGLIIPKDYEKCRIRVADEVRPWREGEVFTFDDTYDHEVWNDTDEERVILLFDFDRPMRFWGRVLNQTFLSIMKLTAYYQEPKRNLVDIEARFEAAVRRADDNMEKLSEPSA